jgi:hypothetical protein
MGLERAVETDARQFKARTLILPREIFLLDDRNTLA